MKNFIFIIGVFFFGIVAFGQSLPDNSKVSWGSTSQTNPKKHTVHKVILKTENEYLIAQKHLRHEIGRIPSLPIIQRYGADLNLLNSLNLRSLDLPKKVMFEDILPLNDRLHLFYSKYDKKDAGKSIFSQELHKKSLEPIGKPRLLARGNSSHKTSSIKQKQFLERLAFHFSPDSSKLMAVEMVNNRFKKNNELIVKTFDQELKLLWSKSYVFPNIKMEVLSLTSLIDNQGNAHFLLKTKENEKWSVLAGKPLPGNLIVSIDGANQDINSKEISLQADYSMGELGMILTKEKNLLITGFYSSKKLNSSSSGSYALLLSASDYTTIFENHLEFDDDFISDKLFTDVGKKRKKNQMTGNSFYYVKDLFLKSNGNIVVIGEMEERQHFSSVRGVNGSGIGSEVLFLKDIAVMEFFPGGERNWITKVKKRQISANDRGIFSSYHASLINDDIYLLFNDHADNIRHKDWEEAKPFKTRSMDNDNALSLVKVNNNGIQSRHGISYFLNTKLVARPATFSLTDDNEILLYEQLNDNYRLGILNFDKNFSYSKKLY